MDLSVIDQVRKAAHRQHRAAMLTGAVLGGFVPCATYTLAHREVGGDAPLYLQVPAYLVAAGLAYSAKTVLDWARLAFRHPLKAVGFVVLTEGVMTFSRTSWLGWCALAILVSINGIATGCNLILDQRDRKKG